MQTHFLEISGKTTTPREAMRHGPRFGVELTIDLPGSTAAHGLRGKQMHSASAALHKATHTDPQILLSDAS